MSLREVLVCFAEHGHFKELATAFYGNYTVQDLLDATHKLRQAAAKLRARNTASSQDIDRMLGLSDGQDSLGTSFVSASSTSVHMSSCPSGTACFVHVLSLLYRDIIS